jgi:hypothetical protein
MFAGALKTRKKRRYPNPGSKKCHPRLGVSVDTGSCFPSNILTKLSGVTRKAEASAKLGCPEESEACLIDKSALSKEEKATIEKTYLRPRKPTDWLKKPNTWLDNFNIRDVMHQYEEAYKDFKFIGPEPIDFSIKNPDNNTCISNEMCKIDLNRLKADGITKVGIVYNLDPSYKGGSHWVANYIDLLKHRIYFFDSYGMEPHKNITYFMKYLVSLDPKMKIQYNGRRFQHKGSECGMYSMYFIIMMMKGMNFRKFVRMEVPDEVMLEFREWLFSS